MTLGRKNYLFCGSEGGGRRAALIYSLIETCKLNRIDPYAYFVDILTKLPTRRARTCRNCCPIAGNPTELRRSINPRNLRGEPMQCAFAVRLRLSKATFAKRSCYCLDVWSPCPSLDTGFFA